MRDYLLAMLPIAIIVCAWMCARRANYAQGKSDAFQQVADDFQGLARATWWPPSQRDAERKKRLLNLCLCDRHVCDALDAALVEARKHWNHPKQGDEI